MKKPILKLSLAFASVWLIAACTSTGDVQSSREDQLLQQIETISALDQRLAVTRDNAERQQLLVQQGQSVHVGIALIKKLQQQKIEAQRTCTEYEKRLPIELMCLEEKSLEDTRMMLMIMLMEQMAKLVISQ